MAPERRYPNAAPCAKFRSLRFGHASKPISAAPVQGVRPVWPCPDPVRSISNVPAERAHLSARAPCGGRRDRDNHAECGAVRRCALDDTRSAERVDAFAHDSNPNPSAVSGKMPRPSSWMNCSVGKCEGSVPFAPSSCPAAAGPMWSIGCRATSRCSIPRPARSLSASKEATAYAASLSSQRASARFRAPRNQA